MTAEPEEKGDAMRECIQIRCSVPAGGQDEGRFCLPVNLEHYFSLCGGVLRDWQALLAMETIGFTYYGLDATETGRLNGISGGSAELLANLCRRIGVQKRSAAAGHLVRGVRQRPHLVMVDDFYLPYGEVRGKQHNQRFIVAQPGPEDTVHFFDVAPRDMTLTDVSPAIVEVFTLEWQPAALDAARVNALLQDGLLGGAWRVDIEAMRRFCADVERRGADLTPEQAYGVFFDIRRPSGPSTIRWQMAKSLQRLAKTTGSICLETLSERLLEVAEQWRTAGNLFFKLSRIPKPSLVRSLAERLAGIIDQEKRLTNRVC